jgi:uncharacterized protein
MRAGGGDVETLEEFTSAVAPPGRHTSAGPPLAKAFTLVTMSTAGARGFGSQGCHMARIRFDFGVLKLDAELLDTATAKAIVAVLPMTSAVLTWGEEVYFDVPVNVAREPDARAVISPGEIAYWPQGPAIAIGFGRTPISKGDEIRLASPCNVFARALGSVKVLSKVKTGVEVTVSKLD